MSGVAFAKHLKNIEWMNHAQTGLKLNVNMKPMLRVLQVLIAIGY